MTTKQSEPAVPAYVTSAPEMVDLSLVQRHPMNPREGDIGAIGESMKHNGVWGGLVVQRSTGYIIAGNHRFEAAKQRGMTEMRVEYADVTDDEALAIMMADNRAPDLSSYNEAERLDILKRLQAADMLPQSLYNESDINDITALVSGVWDSQVANKADVEETAPKEIVTWTVTAPREHMAAVETLLASLAELSETVSWSKTAE